MKTKTKRGGRELNPTDAFRKQARKREIKRNRAERTYIRDAFGKAQNTSKLQELKTELEELIKIEQTGELNKLQKLRKRVVLEAYEVAVRRKKVRRRFWQPQSWQVPVMGSRAAVANAAAAPNSLSAPDLGSDTISSLGKVSKLIHRVVHVVMSAASSARTSAHPVPPLHRGPTHIHVNHTQPCMLLSLHSHSCLTGGGDKGEGGSRGGQAATAWRAVQRAPAQATPPPSRPQARPAPTTHAPTPASGARASSSSRQQWRSRYEVDMVPAGSSWVVSAGGLLGRRW